MTDEVRRIGGAGEYDCVPEPLPTLRHSTAHLMAQAVIELFPGTRLAIGPPIEDGFYYDFDRPDPVHRGDLARIETRMRELARADYRFVREEMSREDAVRYYEERDEPFKVEILEGLPPEAVRVSLYRQGEFVDLCRGPHVPSTGAIEVFKLLDHLRRLLAGRRAAAHAPADLRDGLADPGGAGPASLAPRGGQAPGPPEARAGAGPVHLPGRFSGSALLAAQGHGRASASWSGIRASCRTPRLRGSVHPDPGQQAAVGAVRSLGALRREHVPGGGRGADVQPQAHELPGVDLRLSPRASVVPGPAASVRRDGRGCTGTSARGR